MTDLPKQVSDYLKKIGTKGGKNGKGASKARPAAHYKKLTAIRKKNRELRNA